MTALTSQQKTNLLFEVFMRNEAKPSQWFVLSQAGLKNWKTNTPEVANAIKTGASGFSIGVVQLDFGSGNTYAAGTKDKTTGEFRGGLAEVIQKQGEALNLFRPDENIATALREFNARELAGYATRAAAITGSISPNVKATAQAQFDLIYKHKADIEYLLSQDSITRAAFVKANFDQLSSAITSAQKLISSAQTTLQNQNQTSKLLSNSGDLVAVAL